MKIVSKITTIECSADELRQSNSLSDAFVGALRRAFNGTTDYTEGEEDEDSQESE